MTKEWRFRFLLYDRKIGARNGISGGSGVARGALWIALALAAFFVADSLLFRTGWYDQYLEPDSSVGSLEAQLHWLKYTPPAERPEVLVIGDSRIAEGFSSKSAAAAADNRLRYWNFGLGGTAPRVWYYALRAADPTRRRFAAITIALDNYSDADTFDEFADHPRDQNYLIMQLGLGDCFDYAMSVQSHSERHRSLFGCFFRGMMLRNDVQTFLAKPDARLAHAADWLTNGLIYRSDYGGIRESLEGTSVDWKTRTIHFPDRIGEATQENVRKFVLREQEPQTGALARYRKLWLGRILDLYKNSPTRLIFFQLPRAPFIDPAVTAPQPARYLESSRSIALPSDTFADLERPELFGDGLHLNRVGRPIFSERLARTIDSRLAKGGVR